MAEAAGVSVRAVIEDLVADWSPAVQDLVGAAIAYHDSLTDGYTESESNAYSDRLAALVSESTVDPQTAGRRLLAVLELIGQLATAPAGLLVPSRGCWRLPGEVPLPLDHP